jgi:hypothetical protein
MSKASLGTGRQLTLILLFVPSVARDGQTPIAQERWVQHALHFFGTVFGGATAYPRARGVWRDDERAGVLVMDEPVVVQCFTAPESLNEAPVVAELLAFCKRMGRETHQGEIGLVIDNEYFAITDFNEEDKA